jgi:hypothetical protein
MEHTVALPLTVGHNHEAKYRFYSFDLKLGGLAECCLGLLLLEKGLIEYLELKGAGPDQHSVYLLSDSAHLEGIASWDGDDVALTLGTIMFDLALNFLLTTYRDQIAPVDHIDLELPVNRTDGEYGLVLTLEVPAPEPRIMSFEEAIEAIGWPLPS